MKHPLSLVEDECPIPSPDSLPNQLFDHRYRETDEHLDVQHGTQKEARSLLHTKTVQRTKSHQQPVTNPTTRSYRALFS